MPRAASRPLPRRSCRTLGNMQAPIEYSSQLEGVALHEAAAALGDHYLSRFRPKLVSLLAIPAALLAVVNAALFSAGPAAWAVGFVLLASPLYWVWRRAQLTRMLEQRLKALLKPGAQVAVGSNRARGAGRHALTELEWSSMKRIVEHQGFFLLVPRGAGSALILPTQGIPAAARQLVEQAMAEVNVA